MDARDAIGYGRWGFVSRGFARTITGVVNRWAALTVVLGCWGAVACGGDAPRPAEAAGSDCTVGGHPQRLGCTGLYAGPQDASGSVAIAADVVEFAPAESLWSDGAEKRRFIRLPPGTAIDSRNMDEWVFPMGTKLWKEFSIGGRKVETRYLEKRANGWFRTTYAWDDDQSIATEVTAGVRNVRGTGYDIPAQTDCAECHEGAADGVLGFEAIGLSAPGATGMTLRELTRRGLLTAPPASAPVIPGSALDVAALGWLHANCGNACHNGTDRAAASWTGLHMRLTVDGLGSVQDTDTYKTAVGVVSGFQPSSGAGLDRIKPGDAAHSAVVFRARARNQDGHAGWQMPPIDSNVTDVADVDAVEAWVQSL